MDEVRVGRFRLLSVTLLSLIIASSAVMRVESTDYTATIYVDPEYKVDEALVASSVFTLDFKIRDALNCYSWSMNMSWDPTILTVTNMFPGTFLAGQPAGSTWNFRFEIADGWGYVVEQTNGIYDGVDGDGTLVTFEFTVVDYGHSVIDIDYYNTYIMVYPPYPVQREEVNKENGYFRNAIPGDIQGDTAGTPPDGDVDMFDFFAFADHYATVAGDPNYNILADLQGDTSGTPPDGDVDMFDFFAFADNYGRP